MQFEGTAYSNAWVKFICQANTVTLIHTAERMIKSIIIKSHGQTFTF